jgi:hypothetical protein
VPLKAHKAALSVLKATLRHINNSVIGQRKKVTLARKSEIRRLSTGN